MKEQILDDLDCRGSHYTIGCKNREEAIKLIKEEMFVAGNLKISELSEMMMSKCLDCGSYWENSDCICGECGEDRLSKRETKAFGFTVYKD